MRAARGALSVLDLVSHRRSLECQDVNIPGGRFQDSGGVRLAVGEFAFQTFLQDDVDIIRQAYGLEKLANDVTVVGRKAQPGEETNFSTSGEGSLDLQIASILSPKSDLTWWAVSPYDMDGFMLAYAVQVNDAEDCANANPTSLPLP